MPSSYSESIMDATGCLETNCLRQNKRLGMSQVAAENSRMDHGGA